METIRTIRIADAIGAAENDLSPVSATPRLDSEVLLATVCERDRSWLYGNGDSALDEATWERFRAAIARRASGEPIAHITGSREFWSMNLRVTVDTLVPRPETELLVETGLALLPEQGAPRVLDLGTGTGAIALALGRERPNAKITATDVLPAALDVARANASAQSVKNVSFVQSDWFDGLEGEHFDLIVSNPPYVADRDKHLDQGDCRFEPRLALAAGEEGLDALRIIIEHAPAHLTDQGFLIVEHGHDQGEAVTDLMLAKGFVNIEGFEDLAGLPRAVSAQKCPG